MYQLLNRWVPKKAFWVTGVFLLLLVLSFPVSADFRWYFPSTAISSGNSTYPSVSINDAGQVVVAWLQDKQIYVNRHTPEGGWTESVALTSASVEDASISEPKVILNQSGQALVMWHGKKNADSKLYLRFATMEAWGSWSGAQDVPGMIAQEIIFISDFAFNNSGNAVVAWNEIPAIATYLLKATTFTFKTGWKSTPEIVGPTSVFYKFPQVAMNDHQEAIVTWGDTSAVKAANLSREGVWTLNQTIASEELLLEAPVSINNLSDAEAVVAWTTNNGSNELTHAARWSRTGGRIVAESV